MNDKAAAAGPFAEAARLLEDLAGVRADRQARRAGRRGQRRRAAAAVRDRSALIAARKLVPLPPYPLPDKLYAVIDGTGVPMTARETAGRDGKGDDGRARTREVKLAVYFTQDKLDDNGYPVRDPGSSSYIATFEPASVFAGLVRQKASAAVPGTSASSPFSATAPPGSGTSPPPSSPRPLRSWTCSTPANT